ncbi:hypothetical protein HI914_06740 [Erysiphe necator]|nr:hypothetical protein HI914_06740 [Erysiphe necator]
MEPQKLSRGEPSGDFYAYLLIRELQVSVEKAEKTNSRCPIWSHSSPRVMPWHYIFLRSSVDIYLALVGSSLYFTPQMGEN